MNYSIKAFIRMDGEGYFGECLEVEATARGGSLDETVDRLRCQISTMLQGADLPALGLVDDPTLFITIEDVPLRPSHLHC